MGTHKVGLQGFLLQFKMAWGVASFCTGNGIGADLVAVAAGVLPPVRVHGRDLLLLYL